MTNQEARSQTETRKVTYWATHNDDGEFIVSDDRDDLPAYATTITRYEADSPEQALQAARNVEPETRLSFMVGHVSYESPYRRS